MISKEDICKKIEEIIPEAGKCGIDFNVEYDEDNQAWAVDLHEGRMHLKTFVEDTEADSCLEDEQCISLGLQIGQLKRNLNLYHQS